ncbi:MAG: PPOX class F420-dependent oxidoreductase, partial [bacterium]|nr:PPOX class F420-dependent oxidoreductase [bacterium]
DQPVHVILTTLMPSGQPQSSVVWWDSEGEYIRINTTRGRQKEKNLARDGRVSIVAVDPTNPYRWLEVRGEVVEMTEEGGAEHIEALSWKYRGQQYYGGTSPAELRDRETRVLVRIRPTHVVAYPPAGR